MLYTYIIIIESLLTICFLATKQEDMKEHTCRLNRCVVLIIRLFWKKSSTRGILIFNSYINYMYIVYSGTSLFQPHLGPENVSGVDGSQRNLPNPAMLWYGSIGWFIRSKFQSLSAMFSHSGQCYAGASEANHPWSSFWHACNWLVVVLHEHIDTHWTCVHPLNSACYFCGNNEWLRIYIISCWNMH